MSHCTKRYRSEEISPVVEQWELVNIFFLFYWCHILENARGNFIIFCTWTSVLSVPEVVSKCRRWKLSEVFTQLRTHVCLCRRSREGQQSSSYAAHNHYRHQCSGQVFLIVNRAVKKATPILH